MDFSNYGGEMDWLRLRHGSKFASLSTVALRVRLVGNSDRAIDLLKLSYSYSPTGSDVIV